MMHHRILYPADAPARSRTFRSLIAGLAAAAAALAPAARLGAQDLAVATPPTVVRTLAWRADSVAAFGDTARAMAMLDSAVKADRRDAAAWHRRGMILWAMSRSKRSGGLIRDQKVIRQLIDADSSLRLARLLAPDSSRYAIDLGRYLLNSGTSTQRFAARDFFEKGLEAASRSGMPWQEAEAADELGMTHWRRYENVARRAMTNGVPISTSNVEAAAGNTNSPSEMRNFVETMTAQVEGENWMGRGDYERALELFQRALEASPDHPGARRHYYMALADRDRWDELATVTASRLRTARFDPWTHFARGLALHRLGRGMEAHAAFDSAMVLLSDSERARLTSLARILRTAKRAGGQPSDSAQYAASDAALRAYTDSLYWQLADPLSLTPENEFRNEFMARVVFAELRWSADDLDRRGADTDRGEVWIRYGPPAARFSLGGNLTQFDGNSETWLYANGLSFVFNTPASFGVARYTPGSATRAEQVKATQPATWSNVPITGRIDSIFVQTARFRAAGDSADLVLVAELPVDSLVKGLDVARVPLDLGMGVWTGPSVVLLRDSTRVMVDPNDAVNALRLRTWRERLPAGAHVYRVEALQPDGMRGARALGRVRLAADTGFGTSDLLVAERVATRESAAARRWRDLIVVPNAGRFRSGTPIGLVWETYGLKANAEGGAKYRVVVSVERRFESKGSAFVANVVSGVTGATGLTARESRGKAALRFERSVPADGVALDWLSLDIGNAARGQYEIVVEITDLVGNRAARMTRQVRIE